MAIETLKPGRAPCADFYGNCHKCDGEFRFGKDDAFRFHPGDVRDGPFAQIKCPTAGCGSTVTGYPRSERRDFRIKT